MGTIIFDPVTLTLEFDPYFENVNFANKFWTVSSRALIIHMNIPWDSMVATNNFALMTLTLEFDLLYENFNLAKNFWTVSGIV